MTQKRETLTRPKRSTLFGNGQLFGKRRDIQDIGEVTLAIQGSLNAESYFPHFKVTSSSQSSSLGEYILLSHLFFALSYSLILNL